MRPMLLKEHLEDSLYACWDFLGFVAIGVLLVIITLVFGSYAILRDAFRRPKIQQKKRR